MAYRRILVPLDGSKLSEQALAQVIEVAVPGASIQLLSVKAQDTSAEVDTLTRSVASGSDVVSTWPPIEGVEDPTATGAREKYMRRVREWLTAAEFDVRVDVKTGQVAEEILRAAAGNDLVIIATEPNIVGSQVALGSVVEAVLRGAPCPVLVVPGLHDEAE